MEQRILIVRLLVESLQRRNLDIAVASVTDIHFHILARFRDHDPRHWLGIAKKESSHHAKQCNLGVEGGLWAVRTKSLPVKNRGHQLNTAKYIYDHLEEGGAVWYKQHVLAEFLSQGHKVRLLLPRNGLMTPIMNKGSSTSLRTGAIYALVEINGIWKLTNRSGQTYTPRGRFNFVRQNGRFSVSKTGEHVHLSNGNTVEYAGEIRFGYNRSNRGTIRSWSNASGHYQPLASLAGQAGLPMELFEPIEAF